MRYAVDIKTYVLFERIEAPNEETARALALNLFQQLPAAGTVAQPGPVPNIRWSLTEDHFAGGPIVYHSPGGE